MTVSGPSALAVLTPPGRGGIAVIRCVGPRAEEALAACFRRARITPQSPAATTAVPPNLPEPGALAYGHIIDNAGRPLDEIILHRSGPVAFEVNCHGGPAAVKAILARLVGLGLAEVDADRLMEIEGLSRIVRQARRALRCTPAPPAARILLDQLNGALARAVGRALDEIKASRANEARASIDVLLARWRSCGRFLADPPHIAIAGRPNAGKSTLLNRLVGADRTITSDVPGTTRDTVEAEAALGGLPVVLVDTAGLREAHGAVEREGVRRARRELDRAAVVIYLVDAAEGLRPDDETAIASLGNRVLVTINKADTMPDLLAAHLDGRVVVGGNEPPAISALTGQGVDARIASALDAMGYRAPEAGEAVPFEAEQAAALEAARAAMEAGRPADAARTLESLLK